MEVGEEGDYIYISLHYHHQNDSCIKMGRMEGGGYEGRGRGRLYTYRYTFTTRMIPVLRWAAMGDILMFQ